MGLQNYSRSCCKSSLHSILHTYLASRLCCYRNVFALSIKNGFANFLLVFYALKLARVGRGVPLFNISCDNHVASYVLMIFFC